MAYLGYGFHVGLENLSEVQGNTAAQKKGTAQREQLGQVTLRAIWRAGQSTPLDQDHDH